MSLEGARILLGVSGSIAAYKAAEVARLLVKRGARVQAAMTESAQRFLTPLTLHALTSRPVLTDLFALGLAPPAAASQIEHVEHAHAADLVLIAPATAHTLAKLAAGLADDVLSAVSLATRAPILVAPAMEPGMWLNAATADNLARLRARGVLVVGPEQGELASGRSGLGRMSEPEVIVSAAERALGPRDLGGVRLVITAGPTWEALDPVRVLTNRSTGSMGVALAEGAHRRGAEVHLILGPGAVEPSLPLSVDRVESALDMLQAARRRAATADVFIGCAAVSDFRPAAPSPRKLKRDHAQATRLELVENPDVLATVAGELRASGRPVCVVGFAAETEELEANARRKAAKKGCDLVIGNLVGERRGFGSAETSVLAVPAQGPAVAFGPAGKEAVAQFVLDRVVALGKHRAAP